MTDVSNDSSAMNNLVILVQHLDGDLGIYIYIYIYHTSTTKAAPYMQLSTCVIQFLSGLIQYCFYIGVI